MTSVCAIEPTVALADFSRVDPRAVSLLAERWARRHAVLPVAVEGGALLVATSDPLDLEAEQAVSFATGQRVRWLYAPPEELGRQIDHWYADGASRREGAPPVEVEHLAFGAEGASAASADLSVSVVRLVDELIAEGIRAGASDIHVEPEEQGVAVRHRIDGVLRQVRVLPRAIAPSLVSRVKILSGLDIADRLRPQDGRARVAVTGAVVDLRISTLPASHGEKVVIRVLDGSAGLRTLDAIGFAPGELGRIRGLLEQREGLLLVTGPTGSGKTTTLYAALREVQARGVNVVTVEDPIEYRLPGIVQVQVHERAGLTFSKALRSIMRQDPDVILVGEIRDRETAEIAIQASLTGHLVLSTLHTNDAASAVTRLIDIGIPGYQIATAVKGVVAQRLLRRVCATCRAAGCDACDGSGFRGRIAIAEILVAGPEFERRVSAGASTESIADAARAAGCVTLWESGQELVRLGHTTIDELRRVAAEPVRVVTEPAPAPASPRLRIGWRGWPETSDASDARQELTAAAALLGAHIEVVPLESDLPSVDLVDVVVHEGPVAPRGEPRSALVVALASDAASMCGRSRATPTSSCRVARTAGSSSRPFWHCCAGARGERSADGDHSFGPILTMATVSVGTIDVYLIAAGADGWRVLTLQRSLTTRCPTAWETVHGRIEPGEEPEQAAVREVREETGLEVQRLYNVSVQPFYLHKTHTVELSVCFAAFVAPGAPVTTGEEHSRHEWLAPEDALERFIWPRERIALREVLQLLRGGDAGPVEDVLRVF